MQTLDELVVTIAATASDHPDQDAVERAWDEVLTNLVMNVADPSADPDISPADNLHNALCQFLPTFRAIHEIALDRRGVR